MAESSPRAVVLAPPRDTVEPAYPERETTIPLFLGCDDKFFPHALTAIASVMAHASPANNYDIFIVQSGIPRERMDTAAAWMVRYPNATLRFIDIDASLEEIRNDLVITREFGVATYFRIVAPTLFPEHARIVYLDSDIVALADIADFFRADLGGMQAGVTRDLVAISESLIDPGGAEFWRTQLGMQPGDDYFCAAQLVLDLDRMRREDTQRELFEAIRRIRGARLPDQDVMNAVLKGKVKILPYEWNCFDWVCDEAEEAPGFPRLLDDFLEEIRTARRRVKIIHFTEKKPWTMEYHGKSADQYWRYAAETPFYPQLLEQIRRDAHPLRLLRRRCVTRFQEANFILRMLFAPPAKKEKYAARLRTLRWRRKGLPRQAAFVKALSKTGKEV